MIAFLTESDAGSDAVTFAPAATFFDIFVDVAIDGGLVTPVLRNVDRKSLMELAAELHEVSQRARDRRLNPEDLQGGVF